MRLQIAFTKTGSHWYVKQPQTTADSMTSTVETRPSCLNTASWRTKPKLSTFTFDVRTLGRSWPLCSMGKTWSQPVRSRVADWPNFKAVLSAKFSAKHHTNQMLLWGSNMEAGKIVTEVPRPLRTARSRSRLHTRPSVKLRCVKVKCPGSKMQFEWKQRFVLLKPSGKRRQRKNNSHRMKAGNAKDILEAFTMPRFFFFKHTPFPLSEKWNFRANMKCHEKRAKQDYPRNTKNKAENWCHSYWLHPRQHNCIFFIILLLYSQIWK